jgi:hypothetical protein
MFAIFTHIVGFAGREDIFGIELFASHPAPFAFLFEVITAEPDLKLLLVRGSAHELSDLGEVVVRLYGSELTSVITTHVVRSVPIEYRRVSESKEVLSLFPNTVVFRHIRGYDPGVPVVHVHRVFSAVEIIYSFDCKT